MKRLGLALLSTMLLALAACGGSKVDDETAEKHISKAEEVILLLNDGKYEEVNAMFDEEMKTGLTVEQMDELTPIIAEAGDFEEISKSSIEERDGFYVTVLVGKYSEENRTFTITFNKNEEISGLFIK